MQNEIQLQSWVKQSIYEGKNSNSEILHILKERLKKTHLITLWINVTAPQMLLVKEQEKRECRIHMLVQIIPLQLFFVSDAQHINEYIVSFEEH